MQEVGLIYQSLKTVGKRPLLYASRVVLPQDCYSVMKDSYNLVHLEVVLSDGFVLMELSLMNLIVMNLLVVLRDQILQPLQ